MVQEVELIDGRGHPGQNWIVKFNEIDTVEQARELVGSTILVAKEERPVLEEGEFYTQDLIGMRVVLKETGEPIGSVIRVINTGASDILQVKLNSSINITDQTGKPRKVGGSDPLVWVPFVEAIVPDVDLHKREMLITPPKGLLEVNIRSDERSKKERRLLEWKERKKFQKRLIAAKKKLHEMEQHHVFDGFRYGAKGQRSLLADQIVAVNSKLLQQALQNMEITSQRWNLQEFSSAIQVKTTLKLLEESVYSGSQQLSNSFSMLQDSGQHLKSNGKIAIVLALEDREPYGMGADSHHSERNEGNTSLLLEALLNDSERLVTTQDRPSVPLVLVCPSNLVASAQRLFINHDYFSFDPKKVWFLEEERLPVVSSFTEAKTKHKILMKSPWEILQKPIGSGGLISVLSSHGLLDTFSELGVEYIKVININQKERYGDMLLGLVDSQKANVGVQVFKNLNDPPESLNMVFSVNFMKSVTNQMNKLQIQAIHMRNPHVENVDKEWIDVLPSSLNSYEFHCSIYSCLRLCSPRKICVLEVTE